MLKVERLKKKESLSAPMEAALRLIEESPSKAAGVYYQREGLGHYSYCAVGAAMSAVSGKPMPGCDWCVQPTVSAITQQLYFAIPRWYRAEREGRGRLGMVFTYSDSLSHEGLIAWYKLALKRLDKVES